MCMSGCINTGFAYDVEKHLHACMFVCLSIVPNVMHVRKHVRYKCTDLLRHNRQKNLYVHTHFIIKILKRVRSCEEGFLECATHRLHLHDA